MADFESTQQRETHKTVDLAAETHWGLNDVLVWIACRDEATIIAEREQWRLLTTHASPGDPESVRHAREAAWLNPPVIFRQEGREALELLRAQCEDGALRATGRRELFGERKQVPLPEWRDLVASMMTTRLPGAAVMLRLEDADGRFGIDVRHEPGWRELLFRVADVKEVFPLHGPAAPMSHSEFSSAGGKTPRRMPWHGHAEIIVAEARAAEPKITIAQLRRRLRRLWQSDWPDLPGDDALNVWLGK
jgi:hypothetical protein